MLRQEGGSFGSRQRSREGEMLKLQSRGFLVKLFFSQGFLSCWLQRNRGHAVHSFTNLFDHLLCARHWTRCRGYSQWARQHGSYHCGVYILVGETHRPIPFQCDKDEWEGAGSNSWSCRMKWGLLEDLELRVAEHHQGGAGAETVALHKGQVHAPDSL